SANLNFRICCEIQTLNKSKLSPENLQSRHPPQIQSLDLFSTSVLPISIQDRGESNEIRNLVYAL
ncbi:MAG: hypothetical protein M0R06_22925, partial [Sphaerochaeta sp.]|nr:hypothetical protein [Sphaerochaeta sp.]